MPCTHEPRKQQEAEEMFTAEGVAECAHYTLIPPARCDVVLVQIRPPGQDI